MHSLLTYFHPEWQGEAMIKTDRAVEISLTNQFDRVIADRMYRSAGPISCSLASGRS